MIERYTLKNGIPVFVIENHAAPVVTVQAWVSRGSAYETEKLAGISHFLEHSLFKGTKNRKVGEIALEVERCGGEINAFTSFEETVYYTTLGSRYVEEGLDIICDAIQNPTFDPEEMLREREVILEEIKRSQDLPYRTLSHNLWKTMFEGSPYGRPILGFESTVRAIDHKVLKTYFQANYHAGSIALFVVGDVNTQKVRELAQKKLSRIPKKRSAAIPKMPSYSKKKAQVIFAEKDLNECAIQIAWPTPALSDPSVPALDVLCTALGQGESSALYQYLVKDMKLALDVNMGLVATARCGMAVVGMQVVPAQFQAAIEATLSFLSKISQIGIAETELERVKSGLEAEVIAGKETVEGYARRLGYYTIQFGDPNAEQKYLNSILAVQAPQCTEALQSLLKLKPVLSAVHPMGFDPQAKTIQEVLNRSYAKPALRQEKKPEVTLVKKSSVRFVEKWMDHLPIVSMRLIFPGGYREEKPNQLGVGSLLQRIWTSGTRHYHSKQIAYALDSLGASISAYVGRHTLGLSVEFLSKQWPQVKPLLTDILLAPTFPDSEFELERDIQLQDIRSERDLPGALCQMNFAKSLFGDHPYGRSHLGTEATVKQLTAQDVRGFYRDLVHQSGVVISTVGNFPKGSWENELSGLIQQLPQGGKQLSQPMPIRKHEALTIAFEKKQPLQQSHLMIGFLGPNISHSDRFALKLLHSCLAGQGGRLFLELRDKQSLAYTVAPLQSENPEAGMFGVYIGCSPEKVPVALHGIRRELERVIERPMTQKELLRAKQYWLGRIALDMQRFSSQSMLFGLDEMYGLGFDFSLKLAEHIKALSAEDIRRTAEKYLTLDSAVISMVHNQEFEQSFIEHAWAGKAMSRKVPYSEPSESVDL